MKLINNIKIKYKNWKTILKNFNNKIKNCLIKSNLNLNLHYKILIQFFIKTNNFINKIKIFY